MNCSRYTLLIIFVFSITIPAQAQIDLGADFVSRYVWRGLDLGGSSTAIQPWVSIGFGKLEIGVWSSYTFSDTGSSDELDWYASYSIDNFSFTLTDYSFPGGVDFDYLDENNHVLEISAAYSGQIDAMLAVNLTNDDENSAYLEVGKTVKLKDSELSFFAGAVSKSQYYLTDEGGLINLGFLARKELKITESFALPVSGSYVINPELKKSYFLIGLSL